MCGDGVKLFVRSACHGKANEVTLEGDLRPDNQLLVLAAVRAELTLVNAALLVIDRLVITADWHFFDKAPLVNPQSGMIILATASQVVALEPMMQQQTRSGYMRMIFTPDLRVKAMNWLDFYSQLGTSKSSPRFHGRQRLLDLDESAQIH